MKRLTRLLCAWVASAGLAGLAGLTACALPTPAPDAASPVPEAASGEQPKPARRHDRGAVVAAHPLAVQAGAQMLREGGSAVDAAVAVQAMLTLVEPQSSGLGGGAFALVWDGQELSAWDGRETAPAAANERLFLLADGRPMDLPAAAVGGRAVGVPGVVHLLAELHRAHGLLPWARLWAPAIEAADAGFLVSPRLHVLLAQDPALRTQPAAAAYFYGADGVPHPVGHRLRNPALAAVMRAVAADGPQAFQGGAVAQSIARAVQAHPGNPGVLTERDLAAYRSLRREPLCSAWPAASAGAWRVCGMPPPSSGHLAVMQMLGLMQASAPPPGRDEPAAERLHRAAEASRLAFADRAAYVADPAYVAAPAGDWARLLDEAYLRERAALIGPTRRGTMPPGQPRGAPSAHAPQPDQPEAGTSHLSIVDAQGRAVAMTTSVEGAFGSRVMVDGGTGLPGGFLLNHQLTDFAFEPAGRDGRPVANRVQAGKRPRSSMSPTMVFDATGRRLLGVLGSPGGPAIPHFVAGVLDRMRMAGEAGPAGLQAMLAAPHAAHVGGPLLLEVGRFDAGLVQALRQRGHEVLEVPLPSGLGVLWRDPAGAGWWAAADPRREGTSAGD